MHRLNFVESHFFARLPKLDSDLQSKYVSLYATSRRIVSINKHVETVI